MDNNRFIHKVTRLFPSSLSCRLRITPDVAENSITEKLPRENDLYSLFKKTEQKSNKDPTLPQNRRRCDFFGKFSSAQEKKSPLVTILPKLNQKHKGNFSFSSSNSGLFTSSDEKTTFLSLSSNSSEYLRLKSNQRSKRREEMKRIDETEQAKKQSNATCPVYHELGFDQISTQIYYSKGKSYRRRKTSRCRRKMRRDKSASIEGCCAVVKSSSDPYGDFRASMVEMIMAKQIFGDENLERLFELFLVVELGFISWDNY